MKNYEIEFEWQIHDSRKMYYFRTGTSTMIVRSSSLKEVMNQVNDFARNLPSWEFKRNGIDLQEYRDYPACSYYYRTELSRIIDIKEIE